jgi:hypothetical protein
MLHRILPTTAALLLAVAGPVAAECLDEVAELETRLAALAIEEEPTEPVEVETAQGEVTVEAPEDGAGPEERWFHPPRSVEGARERVEGARQMAEDGDQDGCLELVEEARGLVSGLEQEAASAAQ